MKLSISYLCVSNHCCFILAFKLIEGGQAVLQKLVYLFGNLVCLALALYKCSSMGLLPTYASDWLDFVQPQQVSYCKFIMFKLLTICSSCINLY